MRIDGDGFYLRPDDQVGDAAAIARAFVEDPHLAVDFGLGAVIAGHLVDAHGWRSAMTVVVGGGMLALLVSILRRRALATRLSSAPTS
jgi:hypothetical protein